MLIWLGISQVRAHLGADSQRCLLEHAAIDRGDNPRLLEVADALSGNPAAPRADVENVVLMSRMFDFDGLRALSERLQQRSHAQAGA